MIVECTGCKTKYKIPDERIPESGVEVRCPKCKVIFAVKREPESKGDSLAEQLFGKEVVEQPLGKERVETGERTASSSAWVERVRRGEDSGESEETPVPDTEKPPSGDAAQESVKQEPIQEEATEESVRTGAVSEEATEGPRSEEEWIRNEGPGQPKAAVDERSEDVETTETAEPEQPPAVAEQDPRTLARALVSDILFYNREKRDEGLAEDKILAYLGKEIARSWEIYKERVGIETAIETDHFREAVNEILAEGKKIL